MFKVCRYMLRRWRRRVLGLGSGCKSCSRRGEEVAGKHQMTLLRKRRKENRL